MNIALSTSMESKKYVIYIDTGGSLCGERIKQLLEGCKVSLDDEVRLATVSWKASHWNLYISKLTDIEECHQAVAPCWLVMCVFPFRRYTKYCPEYQSYKPLTSSQCLKHWRVWDKDLPVRWEEVPFCFFKFTFSPLKCNETLTMLVYKGNYCTKFNRFNRNKWNKPCLN